MITEFINLLRAGQEISNPTTWKNRQNSTAALVMVASSGLAVAKVFGVDLNIDDDTLVALCGGFGAAYSIFHIIVTTISSKKVGL